MKRFLISLRKGNSRDKCEISLILDGEKYGYSNSENGIRPANFMLKTERICDGKKKCCKLATSSVNEITT
jgi:hypothetical protein